MLFSDFLRDVEALIRERGVEPSDIQLTFISDSTISESYDGEWRWSHKSRSVRLEYTLEKEPRNVFVWFDGHRAITERSQLRIESGSLDAVAGKIILRLRHNDHQNSPTRLPS
jgi:hypothetical protein